MKMKKIVVLTITGVVILIALGISIGKQKYDSMLTATIQGVTIGKAYGKMVAQSNCMLGLKMQYATCSTTECELSANGYITGCMATAEKDKFCNTVPPIQNTVQTLNWASKTCSEYGLSTDRCEKYIQTYVSICTEQNEGRALSKMEIFENGMEKAIEQKLNSQQ